MTSVHVPSIRRVPPRPEMPMRVPPMPEQEDSESVPDIGQRREPTTVKVPTPPSPNITEDYKPDLGDMPRRKIEEELEKALKDKKKKKPEEAPDVHPADDPGKTIH
jgi:hypothetical protein